MDYFSASQTIKKDIEDSGLLGKVMDAFHGKFEPFNAGSTVDLYHIGKLDSGMYVALRVFRPDVPHGQKPLETQVRYMETYCHNAASLVDNGYRAPKFSIGVTDQKRAGILTEDLSKGDTVRIKHNQDEPYGWITENGERVKVFIDVDALFEMEPSNPLASKKQPDRLKFFSDGSFIEL